MKTLALSSHELAGNNAADVGNILNATGGKVKVIKIYIVPNLAVTAHASNVITTTFANDGNTLGVQTTDSDISGYAAHVEGTPIEVDLTATGDDLILEDGEVISVDVAAGGTGPAYAFQAVAQVERVRVGGD